MHRHPPPTHTPVLSCRAPQDRRRLALRGTHLSVTLLTMPSSGGLGFLVPAGGARGEGRLEVRAPCCGRLRSAHRRVQRATMEAFSLRAMVAPRVDGDGVATARSAAEGAAADADAGGPAHESPPPKRSRSQPGVAGAADADGVGDERGIGEAELRDLVAGTLEELKRIYRGKVPSVRHSEYRKKGQARAALKYNLHTGAFTEGQLEAVLAQLQAAFCKQGERYMEYVVDVLYPECLARVVAAHSGCSLAEAEAALKQG